MCERPRLAAVLRNEDLVSTLQIPEEEIDAVAAEEQHELERLVRIGILTHSPNRKPRPSVTPPAAEL